MDKYIKKQSTLNQVLGLNSDRYNYREGYHINPDTYEGRVKEIFGDSLPIVQNGEILDWGCSKGLTTEEIVDIYPTCRVIGIDINRYAIADARAKRKGEFRIMDGFDPEFSDESFAAVFCMNNVYQTLTHMSEAKARERLQRIGGLVGNSGYLLISGETGFREYDHIIFEKKDGVFVPTNFSFSEDTRSHKRLEMIFSFFNAKALFF